ncbi:hypothetical protein [Sphaerimonospora thailandensis]|uniref:Uncharacterized protein n=1 Tax=Sphaerimonospora thailandensis TaxID=795644 RepID=A0A8J3R8R2_9ACTN|nr:hypothetical protein [Sphaerimonospora thailandensis]GIH69474.1 hypothetical protein Mth01_17270 [Sphaerimonospora thailandensis]
MTRRRLPHARLLEEPVRLPPGHPDSYTTHPDATDDLLADWHDRLWPQEEWIDVEACPHLALDPHPTYGHARAALRQARHGGLLRGAFLRVRRCPCGAWHVRPLILRTGRPAIRPGSLVFAVVWLAALVTIMSVASTSPAVQDRPAAVHPSPVIEGP